jgi:hypothetical protein
MVTKLVVNCTTGVVEEVELTAQELAQRDQDAAAYVVQKAVDDAAKAAAESAAVAGKAKLKTLGLTDDEINALIK